MYIVIRTALNAWMTSIGTGGTKPSLVLEPLVSELMLTVYNLLQCISEELLPPSSGANFSLLCCR
jgi:hypothetical protein